MTSTTPEHEAMKIAAIEILNHASGHLKAKEIYNDGGQVFQKMVQKSRESRGLDAVGTGAIIRNLNMNLFELVAAGVLKDIAGRKNAKNEDGKGEYGNFALTGKEYVPEMGIPSVPTTKPKPSPAIKTQTTIQPKPVYNKYVIWWGAYGYILKKLRTRLITYRDEEVTESISKEVKRIDIVFEDPMIGVSYVHTSETTEEVCLHLIDEANSSGFNLSPNNVKWKIMDYIEGKGFPTPPEAQEPISVPVTVQTTLNEPTTITLPLTWQIRVFIVATYNKYYSNRIKHTHDWIGKKLLKENNIIFPLANHIAEDYFNNTNPNNADKQLLINSIIHFMADRIFNYDILTSIKTVRPDIINFKESFKDGTLTADDLNKMTEYILNNYNIPLTFPNKTAVAYAFADFVNIPIKFGDTLKQPISVQEPEPTPEKILTPDLITLDLIRMAIQRSMGSGHNIDTINDIVTHENNPIPNEVVSAIKSELKSQGYYIGVREIDIIKETVTDILKVYDENVISGISIDSRILIIDSKFVERLANLKLKKSDWSFIKDIQEITPLLDKLEKYLNSSTDDEIAVFKASYIKNGKLPLGVWKLISSNKETGTSLPIKKINLAEYNNLKSIINRIDLISNEDDKIKLIKLYHELPGLEIGIESSSVDLIDKYIYIISSPKSTLNKEDIEAKFASLKALSLNDYEQRVLANLEDTYNANLFQKAHEMKLDSFLHSHAIEIEDFEFGKNIYTPVKRKKILSPIEKIIKNTVKNMKIFNAKEMVGDIHNFLSLPEDTQDNIVAEFESGNSGAFDDAIIYLYYKNKMPTAIYSYIKTLLIGR